MLRYAIIGCGNAATVHLHHLQQQKDTELVAFADPRETLPLVFQQLNLPHFTDYREMVASVPIDAISIASPHYLHDEQILAAAEKGIHVLCEKPLALSYKKAQDVVNFCEKKNIKLAVMMQRRMFNNTQSLERVLREQKLGKIEKIDYQLIVNKKTEYYRGWRGKKELAGGGVLLCQGLHDLDRIIHCMGEIPVVVSSEIKTLRSDITVEDWAQANLQFPGGAHVSITATTYGPHEWSGEITLVGEKGRITLDAAQVKEWNVPDVLPPSSDQEKIPGLPSYYDPCHGLVITPFLDAIQKNGEPLVNGKSTLPALKVLFEIYDKSDGRNGK